MIAGLGSAVVSFFLLCNAGAAGLNNNLTNSIPGLPLPFSEQQVAGTLVRINYRNKQNTFYGQTVDRGLIHLDQIIKKMDLSTRPNVKAALMGVMKSDPTEFPLISNDTRKRAAQLLGQAKLVNMAADEIIGILASADPELGKIALIEFAKTTKINPNANLLEALRGRKFYDTLSAIALQTADRETILFLIQVSLADKNFERLFGLNLKEAADEVVKVYKAKIDPPLAPTDLAVKVTTYRSLELSWKDNSTNEDGFIISRALGNGSFTDIATLPSNQIYYSDSAGLSPVITYRYKVKVFNSNQAKPESNEVSIETPNIPSPLPDPIPPIPSPPTSPSPALSFLELTNRLQLKIEGVLHADTVAALLTILETGATRLPTQVALPIGQLLETQFERKLYDYDGLSTSLGLWAVAALKSRANYEGSLVTVPNAPANKQKLLNNATALEKIFTAPLEYLGPALPIP